MKLFLTSTFSTVGDRLLDLIDKPAQNSLLAFIPTASKFYQNETPWIDADRNKLLQLGFQIHDIDLAEETESTLKLKLDKVDLIFVAGGSTTFLLQKSRESGFLNMLPKLLKRNKIYIGSSAGSIIVGPTIEPYKDEELKELPADFSLTSFEGLHLIDFMILPHYNQEKYSVESQYIIEKYGKKYDIRPLKDNQIFEVIDGSVKLITV